MVWRRVRPVMLPIAALAALAGVRARTQTRTPLATLTGASLQISGGAAGLNAAGQLQVFDGTEMTLTGAAAQLGLARGGSIHLCGPAQVSLASGGQGALLISLSRGAVDLRYASGVPDSLLTPDFRVTSVVPPGQLAAVSAAAAVEPDGTLCLANTGSALSVERLWDGTQQYVINGQALAFHPAAAPVPVSSCPCQAAAPAAVATAPAASAQAGTLFPTQPALVVQAGQESVPAKVAAPAAAAPARPHHRNALSRFFHWLVGKR
ncbi:MAG TPA: hypothetical protein VN515_09405 [Terriglobales bacterium]|nr:hypothetical protein [Terriglobales bacterium]